MLKRDRINSLTQPIGLKGNWAVAGNWVGDGDLSPNIMVIVHHGEYSAIFTMVTIGISIHNILATL